MNWFVIKNKKTGRFLINSTAVGIEIPEISIPNYMRDLIFCEDEIEEYFTRAKNSFVEFDREKYEIIPSFLHIGLGEQHE